MCDSHCVTKANSGLLVKGVTDWLQLGIPASKLVLCLLPAVPFHGAPCSDAAGSQVCLKDIAASARGWAGLGWAVRSLRTACAC